MSAPSGGLPTRVQTPRRSPPRGQTHQPPEQALRAAATGGRPARASASTTSSVRLPALVLLIVLGLLLRANAARHPGEDQLAEAYSHEVIATSTHFDGTERKPMRVAEARLTLGVIAARLDQAVAHGRQALVGDRKSLPSLLLCAQELGSLLRERYADEPAAMSFLEELRTLSAA